MSSSHHTSNSERRVVVNEDRTSVVEVDEHGETINNANIHHYEAGATPQHSVHHHNTNNSNNPRPILRQSSMNSSSSSSRLQPQRSSASSTSSGDESSGVKRIHMHSAALGTAGNYVEDGDVGGDGRGRRCRWLRGSIGPCGLSGTATMILLIAIPIIFLITYTAIPLGEATAAQRYLRDHRGIIESILKASLRVQEERRDSSLFLVTTPNTTLATSRFQDLEVTRGLVDIHFSNILRLSVTSDMEHVDLILESTQSLVTELASERRSVDTRTVIGPSMRATLLLHVERTYSLMLLVARDSRAKTLQTRFGDFMLLGRIQDSAGLCRAIGTAILNRDGYDDDNFQEMYAMVSSINRDVVQVRASGSPEAQNHINTWQASNLKVQFYDRVNKMLTRDVSIFSNISLDDWLTVSNNFVNLLHDLDTVVLDSITNGELLEEIAVTEGMKMLGAVLACIVAASLVIYFNNQEQEKLETALRSTRILARAVQRFVPKNQLRTMGVRSIIEVQAGLQTEVATVMLTCGIKNFGDLARIMNNTELFDWISHYLYKMTQVTQQQRGYVDLFFGDQLHNVFSVPKNAVNAAILMQVATDQLNSHLVAEGRDTTLSIGIGIHYLVAVTGVFGDSNTRLSVAMVSSEGMLATRLEGMTKTFGSKIIATESVVQHLPNNFEDGKGYRFRLLGTVASRLNKKDRMTNQLMTASNNNHNSFGGNNNNYTATEEEAPTNRSNTGSGYYSDENGGGGGSGSSAVQGRNRKNSNNHGSPNILNAQDHDQDEHYTTRSKSRKNRKNYHDSTTGTTTSGTETDEDGMPRNNTPQTSSSNSAAAAAAAKKKQQQRQKQQQERKKEQVDSYYNDPSRKVIAIYDIFQTDHVTLKTFKVETLEQFEEAINISEENPEEAYRMLKKLSRKAKRSGIVDAALDRALRMVKEELERRADLYEPEMYFDEAPPPSRNTKQQQYENRTSSNKKKSTPKYHLDDENVLPTSRSRSAGTTNNKKKSSKQHSTYEDDGEENTHNNNNSLNTTPQTSAQKSGALFQSSNNNNNNRMKNNNNNNNIANTNESITSAPSTEVIKNSQHHRDYYKKNNNNNNKHVVGESTTGDDDEDHEEEDYEQQQDEEREGSLPHQQG